MLKTNISFIGMFLFMLLTMAFGSAICLASDSNIAYENNPQYKHFDESYSSFSRHFFKQLAHASHYRRYTSIRSLSHRAKQLYDTGRPADAVALILANSTTVNSNINSKGIIEIENMLLDANEYTTANNFLTQVKNEADPSVISNVLFAFARYEYARGNWQKTIDIIDKVANDLPEHDLQHAMLIEGVALQNLKHHRKSLKVYGKIPKNSDFYTTARINMAVANIRQDWWSDGYTILNALLKDDTVNKNKDVSDRIHTIIGYSFLQQEYFRNSRDAFRNVALKSRYTNQALLGIALDAAYQKDYVGALNAVRILRNKTGHELQVDEANLLLPYFYEKLGQSATASAGYTDAIKYYEDRLRAIKLATGKELAYFTRTPLDNEKKILYLDGEPLDFGKLLPDALFQQKVLLGRYRDAVTALGKREISSEYASLENKLASLLQNNARKLLEQKAQYLTDYMNQCRYGLARLYDSNAANSK